MQGLLQRIDLCMLKFPWVQMVVLSELAGHGPHTSKAEAPGGPTETAFREAAARHGIWLIPGSVFERSDDGAIYNTALVIAPDGQVATRYRKMFPFYPYEAGVAAGREFCVFDVPEVGRFGVSICYDIWFPETNRMLTALGAEVLLHPVLTSTVDRNVELAMAQAAAAQFQMYVFDINGLGEGGVGRSCVVNPAGALLHQAGAGEEIVPIEIDLEKVRRQRETGLHGLGQPLKSFRDYAGEFPVYERNYPGPNYPRQLGPLQMPQRGSRDIAPDPTALPLSLPTGIAGS